MSKDTTSVSSDETSTSSTKTTESSIIDPYDNVEKLHFTSRETLYYKTIDKYIKKLDVNSVQKMADIIDCKSKISLRLLDWFVTNYANKYKTRYKIDLYGDTIDFTVHIGYKAQLKSYRKRYFDPFRRREKKFYYYYYNQEGIKNRFYTTICQLNFFRWIFEYNILNYVEQYYDTIKKEMIKSNKEVKKAKLNKNKKKIEIENKTKINSPHIISVNSNELSPIVISFD